MLPGMDASPLKREFKRLMKRAVPAVIANFFEATTQAAARSAIGAVGAGTFAASGANNDITELNALTVVPTVIATSIKPIPTRQTVLSGPVDTNGFSAFGGSTGSTTVTAAGTLVATAANGFGSSGQVDRIGSIINPSWTGLSTNGTMYLYLDIAANGTCTTGSTTLEPTYQWGGAYSATNNQFTFNIQEMIGKVGNGTTAAQTYREFVGEVTVSGGVVTAINWCALMGRYDSGYTATLPYLLQISKSHNIGCVPADANFVVKCTTAELGYSVGDVLMHLYGATATPGQWGKVQLSVSRLQCIAPPTSGFVVNHKSTGAANPPTAASWAYKFVVNRGW